MEEQRLWAPGQGIELHDEYPVPTNEELRERWLGYLGGGEVIDAPGVLGVLRVPEEPPAAYKSVDLCEVVRETFRSVRRYTESANNIHGFRRTHHYTDVHPFIKESGDMATVVQVLMANGLVEPIAEIEEEADLLRNARQRGIYTFANTSTLPGCETATIQFFEDYMPGCFDGLVLPRNHLGAVSGMNKGVAARNVITHFSGGRLFAAVHIDAPHHNRAFRAELGGLPHSTIATVLAEHFDGSPVDEGSIASVEPLHALRVADQFLNANMQR